LYWYYKGKLEITISEESGKLVGDGEVLSEYA